MGMMKLVAPEVLKTLNQLVDRHVKFADEPTCFSEWISYVAWLRQTDKETYIAIMKDIMIFEREIGLAAHTDEIISSLTVDKL